MRNKLVILLSLAGAALLLISATVTAQERLAPVISSLATPTYSFGMIGLGAGQTARLNAVNLVRTAPPIAVAIAQVPCKVELDLYDGQGKLIKQSTVANLGFGQAGSLDLARGEITSTASHVDIAGMVKVGSGQSFFCSISSTLEIFDTGTGATAAILATPSSSPLILTGLPLSQQP